MMQLILIIVVTLLALGLLRGAGPFVRRVSRQYGRLAERRALAVLVVGVLGFASSVGVSLLFERPAPFVSDEFSYLFAADTFAHGRLTNPTHPMWIHFETLGIIQQPTNASKYPPGHGMLLAAGKALGGHPVVGVWIGIGLMCAALCWMLQAWVPPRWALLGGLLAVFHFGFFCFWSQGYMGGQLAAAGGALLYGALRRLVRTPRAKYGLLFALGVAILANTRPYEGLLTTLPALGALLVWLVGKNRPTPRIALRRVVAPIGAVLALMIGFMAYYNGRVTGKVTKLPYIVHEETYAVAPSFVWQPLRPTPDYHHESIRREYTGQQELGNYLVQRSAVGFLRTCLTKLHIYWQFYFGVTLTIPLIMLPWVVRKRGMPFVLGAAAFVLAGMMATMAWGTHYAAPGACLFLLIQVQALRCLSLCRWNRLRVGQALVYGVVAACLAIPAFSLREPDHFSPSWRLDRERIAHQLEQESGKHLVIVWYGPNHNTHNEWIYNAPDIDASKIVWARGMDAESNRRLLTYFKDRRVWMLEPDTNPPSLTPYTTRAEK